MPTAGDDANRQGTRCTSPDSSESTLLRAAVGGNTAALKVLLTSYHDRLREPVSIKIPASLRGSVDADDVLQEAYVEVFRRIGSFEDRGPDAFARWIMTIALSKLRNAIRRRRAAKRGGDRAAAAVARANADSMIALLDLLAAPGHSPSQSAARSEAVAAVQNALSALPDDYRRAVWLVYIQGRTTAAAAEEMGRTERAVENLCYRAKRRLRDLLGSRSRFLSKSD